MALRSVALLMVIVHAATASLDYSHLSQDNFKLYAKQFNKTYKTEADANKAFDCWRENSARMDIEHRMNPMAQFGANELTDICWVDFKRTYLGSRPSRPAKRGQGLQEAQLEAANKILELAPSVDWREKGAVNPIQNQGQCGSCWAFGTTANIEGQYYLWGPEGEKGTLKKLSEQMLVSCDHYKDNTGSDLGCQGGWPDRAVHWLTSQTKGQTLESNYPYTSGGGSSGKCDTSKMSPPAFKENVAGIQDLMSNETYVAAYVARWGPVTVGLDATQDWQQYKGGILNASCDQRKADHAVVIVGYGSDQGQDYWIIRNSWGPQWGEKGYVRLNRGNNCNSVVGHATSVFFQNRSACLSPCKGNTKCCGGDCCPTNNKDYTCCKAGGCCKAPKACCGGAGGNQCCDNPKNCCGGQCCDPKSATCSPDGKTCCPNTQLCGKQCCSGGTKCCKSQDGKAGTCTKSITDSCCSDGTSCPIMKTCCGGKCCPFMSRCIDGKCSGGPGPGPGPSPPGPSPPGPSPPGPSPPGPSPPGPSPPGPSPPGKCGQIQCPSDFLCCKGPQFSSCCPGGFKCNAKTGTCAPGR